MSASTRSSTLASTAARADGAHADGAHAAARDGTSALHTARLAIIGAGTMGRTLAAGLLRARITPPERITVTDHAPATAAAIAGELGVEGAADNAAAARSADVVVLCVKPRDVAHVLTDLVARDALAHRPLLISIAAGVATTAIDAAAGGMVPIVRAMPNTACRIGQGMTVVAPGPGATAEHLAIAQAIFSSLGRCLVLEERHLDAVTAVSASGVAFACLVIEAMADGGVMCGLPRGVALELVAQMTLGTAALVLSGNTHPALLRDDVTTPGGCTIAGLLTLEEGRVRAGLARAIETTTRVAAGLGR
jgi:pyrroline-5-carboxylate reductase